MQIYHTESDSWSQGPELNVARYIPGSTILKSHLYVFGGATTGDVVINSLEVLSLSWPHKTWELIQLDVIPARYLPIVSPTNDHRLLIMGGRSKDANGRSSRRNDAFLFEIKRKSARAHEVARGDPYTSYGPTLLQSNEKVVTGVVDREGYARVMLYDHKNKEVKALSDLGKCN